MWHCPKKNSNPEASWKTGDAEVQKQVRQESSGEQSLAGMLEPNEEGISTGITGP